MSDKMMSRENVERIVKKCMSDETTADVQFGQLAKEERKAVRDRMASFGSSNAVKDKNRKLLSDAMKIQGLTPNTEKIGTVDVVAAEESNEQPRIDNQELVVRYGFTGEAFKMGDLILEKATTGDVRGKKVVFGIKMGKLVVSDKQYKETFVLEITHDRAAEDAHARSLPLAGFSSHLMHDYGETANNIALEVCRKMSLHIYNHINSWPTFRAVVAALPESSKAARRSSISYQETA